MSWLACGVVYSVAYVAIGWLLRGQSDTLLWFRIIALLVPPLTGVVVIVRRRHVWTGCHWLFWATIALGLTMSAIGLVGWTVDELLLGRETSWLGWFTVFALFGAAAPLLGLLAQPHRGSREAVTATTAVDIAGIAVMTGFLYSRFVIGPDLTAMSAQPASLPLLLLSEFQQLVVVVGMAAAAFVARDLRWGATYRRLALGLFVNAIILSIANLAIWQGLYRSGFVYDVIWIMPYAFYPWAASQAPASADVGLEIERHALTPSRPWVVFSALCLIPLFDYGLRQALPLGPLEGFRDLSTAITIFSVLPLLMARLAVEHGEAQQADRKRRLLAAATEQADELISIMRPDGGMEHANQTFCRTIGYESAEVVQMAASDFLAEQSRSQVATITDAARRDGIWRGALVRRRRDGSTFLTSCTVTSLADDAGRVTQLVNVERDVTRETELRDQLIHAERLAAAGQLVSGVAHELNNPLQSVVGFAELLLEGERRKEAREDIEQILSEATRAAKIVQNLLAFVRRSSVERTPASLNALVQSAVALRAYEFGVANIEIDADYSNDVPPVRVNREEIQQVLLNLLLNAEHAMKANGERGRLRVRTMTCDAGVVVEVHDNGPGVPASMAGRIFEPFFSTKEVGQGTGLGLSIALGIVEAHGGTLLLADASQGACFRLTLPAAEATSAVDAREKLPVPVRYALAGQRALVADDEEPVRQLLRRLLTRRGFAVDLAIDGRMAERFLERSRYDVVLCDVKMPNGGGLALYDSIRQRQRDVLDRFVLISGDILNPQLHCLSDSSQVPLLSKPFDAAKLDDVLDQVISRRFASQPVAAVHPA
ncbi:MAG: hybrid sensor histidine kinase/response regulator [Vicinamibacterales bacterium]